MTRSENRKELRYTYRHNALNMYGKLIRDLTPKEVKVILDTMLEEFILFYPNETTKFFKEVFKREIKFALGGKT